MAKKTTPVSPETTPATPETVPATPETTPATPETTPAAPEIPQIAPESIEKVTVASPIGLNLRCGPSKSYASLKLLPDGAELSVHELPGKTEVPGWALVETAEGLFGWACADFLQAAAES